MSEVAESHQSIAEKLLGDAEQAPKFFNLFSYEDCSTLQKCLPNGRSFRVFKERDSKGIFAPIFDDSVKRALFNPKSLCEKQNIITLVWNPSFSALRVALPGEIESPNEFEVTKLAALLSRPETRSISAVQQVCRLKFHYKDLLDLLCSDSATSEDLEAGCTYFMYHKGLDKAGRQRPDTVMNCGYLGKMGKVTDGCVVRYVFLTHNEEDRTFRAYVPQEKYLPAIKQSMARPTGAVCHSLRFGADGQLPKPAEEEGQSGVVSSCGCDICQTASKEWNANITASGPERRFNYTCDAVEYFELLGFEKHLPALKKCLNLSMAALDIESITQFHSGADGKVEQITGEKIHQTGLVGTQSHSLLGLAWNYAEPGNMDVEIFDTGRDSSEELTRFCSLLLEIAREKEEEKRRLLRPVFDELEKIYVAHREYFLSQGLGEQDSDEVYKATMFYRFEMKLERICTNMYIGSLNGASYDHIVLG